MDELIFFKDRKDAASQLKEMLPIDQMRSEKWSIIAVSSGALELGAYFRLLGNATWQETENRGDVSAFNGMELPGRWQRSCLVRLESSYYWFRDDK